MKNKTILLTLMALTIISVTVMTVSCRKELKVTPDNTVQFTGDRTVYENEVITKLCLDTVVRTDFYGLTNEQAAEAAALAIKGFYDHYSISLPTTLSSIKDQFEYYVTNLVLADPNTVWTGTISLIYDSLTAGELGIIEEARGIFTQDFSSMTSSEICEKISDDAEDLLVEHSLNGEDSLLASTLMPVIMGVSEYCLALSDGVPADSMAKIIQAGATGYIVGHAAALLLNLEDGLARIDNGLFMASLAGGRILYSKGLINSSPTYLEVLDHSIPNGFKPAADSTGDTATVVAADIAGAMRGAKWGAIGGFWGRIGGAITLGVAASLIAADLYVSQPDTPTVVISNSNPFEYIGRLHNNCVVTAYSEKNTFIFNDEINDTAFASFIVNYIYANSTFGESEENYDTSEYKNFLLTTEIPSGSLPLLVKNDYNNHITSKNEHDILKVYLLTLGELTTEEDVNSYTNEILSIVYNSTDLSSDEKLFLMLPITIAKYSKSLFLHNN